MPLAVTISTVGFQAKNRRPNSNRFTKFKWINSKCKPRIKP
uniref:Uncharacterized protein n=1 Tax=Ralstonia syzygii R24 TaxID=907261 RepID=G3A3M5_9RALS|nr:hypothetical protein RALSY_30224 [Ralstonia syzygii R24]